MAEDSNILDHEQLQLIKICGKKLATALDFVTKSVKPGVSTMELDDLAEKKLIEFGCVPAFKNYFVAGAGEFPSTLCVSVNDEIVHGLPSLETILKEGDVVSLDIGAGFKGVYTDMAVTVGVGKISKEAQKLIHVTEKALYVGIDQAKLNNKIGDIGYAIENFVQPSGFGIIRDYVGHGIGTKPHLWPQIPNFGHRGTGPTIKEGMALAIEPMITLGAESTKVMPNNWTVKTTDESFAAHFEYTIIIENGKTLIVTQL